MQVSVLKQIRRLKRRMQEKISLKKMQSLMMHARSSRPFYLLLDARASGLVSSESSMSSFGVIRESAAMNDVCPQILPLLHKIRTSQETQNCCQDQEAAEAGEKRYVWIKMCSN